MNTREVVEEFYEAAVKGDMEGFFARLADDVVIREPGFLPYGGTWRGKQGVRDMLGPAAAVLDIPTLQLRHIVAEADRAFTVLAINRVGTDETMVIAEEAVVRDGKIAVLQVYVHDAGTMVAPA